MDSGAVVAATRFIEARNDTLHYFFTERDFNTLGYQFYLDAMFVNAEEVFRLNALLFPQSFNVYDSYGDALAKNGKKKMAIAIYQQAIALNPSGSDTREKLNKLQ